MEYTPALLLQKNRLIGAQELVVLIPHPHNLKETRVEIPVGGTKKTIVA
jgi:hypothetical protein